MYNFVFGLVVDPMLMGIECCWNLVLLYNFHQLLHFDPLIYFFNFCILVMCLHRHFAYVFVYFISCVRFFFFFFFCLVGSLGLNLDYSGLNIDLHTSYFSLFWSLFIKSYLGIMSFKNSHSFKSLKKQHQKFIKTQHHVSNLQTYIGHNVIPKGSCLNITPNIGPVSEGFQRRWKSILRRCSTQLMSLCLSWDLHKLGQIKSGIASPMSSRRPLES
jgi:hypothetical protein